MICYVTLPCSNINKYSALLWHKGFKFCLLQPHPTICMLKCTSFWFLKNEIPTYASHGNLSFTSYMHKDTMRNNFQWFSSVHGHEEGLCCSLFPLMAHTSHFLIQFLHNQPNSQPNCFTFTIR